MQATTTTLWASRPASRMVQQPDLVENTRYSQTGFEDAIPTLQGDFLRAVTRCYAPSAPPGPLLRSPLDFIRIGFFDHTGLSDSLLPRRCNTSRQMHLSEQFGITGISTEVLQQRINL